MPRPIAALFLEAITSEDDPTWRHFPSGNVAGALRNSCNDTMSLFIPNCGGVGRTPIRIPLLFGPTVRA